MLTDKEADVLSALAMLRFMTTSQIHKLHGFKGEYGIKVTRRLLLRLEQKGLVLAWQPSKYAQKIYYLSKLGAKTMEFEHGYEQLPTFRKTDKTLHQTYVSEVYASLHTAGPGRIVHFSLNKKNGDIIPDAMIRYEHNNRLYLFFIEVDTGNESLLYIKDVKLERYLRTFSQLGDDGGSRRIVFLTLQEHRRNALRRMTESFPLPVSVYELDEFAVNPSVLLTAESESPHQ